MTQPIQIKYSSKNENPSETVELNIVESFFIVSNELNAINMNEVESGQISGPVSLNESHSFIAKKIDDQTDDH